MNKKLLDLVIETQSTETKTPDWVNNSNRSGLAYSAIGVLQVEKLKYIHSHKLETDFSKKSNYLISISELGRSINTAVPTLSSTSSYSEPLMSYLKEINTRLETEKKTTIQKYKRTRSKGTKQKNKDEIRSELNMLKSELKRVKSKNAEDQAMSVIKRLPLPVKRLLGLDC